MVGGWLAFKVIRLVVAVGCRWVACIQIGQVCDVGVCVDGCLASKVVRFVMAGGVYRWVACIRSAQAFGGWRVCRWVACI